MEDGNYLRTQTHNILRHCSWIRFLPEAVPSYGACELRYRSTGLIQASRNPKGYTVDTFDIHNRERNLRNAVRRIKNSRKISKKNKELILKFHDECFSNSLSIDRVLFYLDRLSKIAQWLRKNFQTATKEDLKELTARIERALFDDTTS